MRYERDNYLLETRIEFGYAARNNRRRNTGTKVHRISSTYVVGVIDEAKELGLGFVTFGKQFIQRRAPVLYSAYPMCGCTQGQHAAQPNARLAEKDVSCKKCCDYPSAYMAS